MSELKFKNNYTCTVYYPNEILKTKGINDPLKCKRIIDYCKYENRSLRYQLSGVTGNEIVFIDTTADKSYTISSNHSQLIITSCGKISSGDKIYFCDSTFPSLLLGRLDLKLKRTTKIDAADAIISDYNLTYDNCFGNSVLIDEKNNIFIPVYPGVQESKKQYSDRIDFIKNQMKILYNYDLNLYCHIKSAYEIYELYNKNQTKFVSTTELTKYVISQLPVLQQDESDNICYMLKSQDKATVSTALGTLQYYNFFDQGIDLLGALVSSKCTDLPNNREAEYIYSLFGLHRSTIIGAKYYRTKEKIHFFMDAMNNFVVAPTMSTKDKVYTVLRSILFDQIRDEYGDELDRLNITLNLVPNDKNGETDVSSSEVEGV